MKQISIAVRGLTGASQYEAKKMACVLVIRRLLEENNTKAALERILEFMVENLTEFDSDDITKMMNSEYAGKQVRDIVREI